MRGRKTLIAGAIVLGLAGVGSGSALGAYAGGLDALDRAIAGLFGRARFRVLMTGRDRLHLFPADRLAPIARLPKPPRE